MGEERRGECKSRKSSRSFFFDPYLSLAAVLPPSVSPHQEESIIEMVLKKDRLV